MPRKIEIAKTFFVVVYFFFQTGKDMCRLFPSVEESKDIRGHGHMEVGAAVSTMHSDLQMDYIILF